MYRERILTKKLVQLQKAFPVVVVSGARQVGKKTLLRHVFPDHDYSVFDPSIDLENARGEPDLFLRNHPSPRDASGLMAFRAAHRSLRIAVGAILCAVDRPRWVTEEIAAIPWNVL